MLSQYRNPYIHSTTVLCDTRVFQYGRKLRHNKMKVRVTQMLKIVYVWLGRTGASQKLHFCSAKEVGTNNWKDTRFHDGQDLGQNSECDTSTLLCHHGWQCVAEMSES